MIKKVLNLFLNVIYPSKCIFCRELLEPNTESFVCGKCREKHYSLSDKICCIRCGKPLVSFGEKKLCYHCLNETHFYYKQIVSAFEYSGEVKNSILRYKDNPIPVYASVYAEYLYEMYNEKLLDKGFDYVIGVPCDKKRALKRGVDPLELLCTAFSKLSGLPYYKNCLKKVRTTQKQSKLSYSERQSNLNNSFRALKPEKIKDKTFLVIDDVCTTRATIKECARELKFNGAKNVYGLTVATTIYKPKII